ncbi:MAG TPA: sialidase family protein, partial [Gemmataceae bacterium]|nr:sialidase family protein [Gemmataceae bacterium]
FLAVFVSLWIPAGARGDVRTVRTPNGGKVPDVVLDAKGVLHMTYGDRQSGNAYYVQSPDGGKTFTKAVQLNRRNDTVTVGMERGPRLALGKDGFLHVVWLGFYKAGGSIWHTRSTDGGKSFEPEQKLEDPAYGLDNAALATDAKGNVFVLWTGGFPGFTRDPESDIAAPIIMVRSTDNGKTFSKNELLKSDHPASGHACGCCRLEARIGGPDDANLYVAFRGGYKGIRDPWLLVGKKTENNFRCLSVHADQWKTGCPMQGMPFSVDSTGKVLFSWMSRDRAYWTMSDEGAKTFLAPIATPEKNAGGAKAKQAFPMAVSNAKKEILLMWTENGDARWAMYGADGSATGQHGVAGTKVGQDKPTAFAGTDGQFYIVW